LNLLYQPNHISAKHVAPTCFGRSVPSTGAQYRFVVLNIFYLLTVGVEVVYFRLITLRHAPQSVGLLWTRDRPIAETEHNIAGLKPTVTEKPLITWLHSVQEAPLSILLGPM
jgi:hypothetical protein